MRFSPLSAIVLASGVIARADVVSSEFNFLPINEGWTLVQQFCDPETWIEDGRYHQDLNFDACPPPPEGGHDSYSRSIEEQNGTEQWYLEWRSFTDGDRSEFPWGAPTVLATGNFFGVNYWFAVARDQVKFSQDDFTVILFVDLDPDVPHTFRLELYGEEQYLWYIDGDLVYTGVPGGPFPSFNSIVTWRGKAYWLPCHNQWDFIRYGTIATSGSGDFDSEGDVDLRDFFYFDECLGNGGPDTYAGPSCAWADMDQDGDVDFHDFGHFQFAFTGSE